ncbi:MAG: hypothetical protein ACRDTT_16590 [Pseudonocardiaceae bacterium]
MLNRGRPCQQPRHGPVSGLPLQGDHRGALAAVSVALRGTGLRVNCPAGSLTVDVSGMINLHVAPHPGPGSCEYVDPVPIAARPSNRDQCQPVGPFGQ